MLNPSALKLTPYESSAGEDYQPPDANELAGLLSTAGEGRPRDPEFNSGNSTPFVMGTPGDVAHWKLAARVARSALEKLLGKWAMDTARHVISDSRYWRTEANHYQHYWIPVTAEQADQFNRSRPQSLDQIRDMIEDPYYWCYEAKHYENWMYVIGHCKEPKKRPSPSSSGICKRKKTLQPTSRLTSELGPVSSTLRRVTSELGPVSSRLRGSIGVGEGRAKLINAINGNDASKETRL